MWSAAAHAGLVAAGGFFGAIARYYLSQKIADRFQTAVPYGTLTINWTGSFLLGLLIGCSPDSALLLLAGTGFLGAFTTFSTFKQESVALAKKSRIGTMIGYITATYCFGILLAWFGYTAGQAFG